MTIVRHAAWVASAAVISMASRFAVTALLARRLTTTTAFGQFAYAQWLIDIAFLTCSLGATGAVSRYFAEYRHESPRISAIARRWRPYSLLLPCLAGVAALIGARVTGLPLHMGDAIAMFCWSVLNGVWGMHTAALAGLQRFDRIFFSTLLAGSFTIVGVLLLPLNATNLQNIFTIMALASAMAACVGAMDIDRVSVANPCELSKGEIRSIMAYAVNVWITALLWNLAWSRGEVPVIRVILGDDAIAHYSVAATLYGGVVGAVMLGVGGIAPQVASLLGRGQAHDAMKLCRDAMDVQLLICGIGGLALIWFAPELLHYGFGSKFADSARLLAVLAIGLPALTFASHNHFLQITTQARYNRNSTLIGVVLLVILSWFGVTIFGIEGAAWAKVSTSLALGFATGMVFWKHSGPSFLPRLNLVWVVALLIASYVINVLIVPSLFSRVVLALLLGSSILAGVRDRGGRPVALKLWLKIPHGR